MAGCQIQEPWHYTWLSSGLCCYTGRLHEAYAHGDRIECHEGYKENHYFVRIPRRNFVHEHLGSKHGQPVQQAAKNIIAQITNYVPSPKNQGGNFTTRPFFSSMMTTQHTTLVDRFVTSQINPLAPSSSAISIRLPEGGLSCEVPHMIYIRLSVPTPTRSRSRSCIPIRVRRALVPSAMSTGAPTCLQYTRSTLRGLHIRYVDTQ